MPGHMPGMGFPTVVLMCASDEPMNSYARFLVLLLPLTTNEVIADSLVDLTVTGRLTPDACRVELSDEGTVEHGKIPTYRLNASAPTALPGRVLELSVICTRPMLFALVGIDNRPESAITPGTFGLGVNAHAPGQRLGSVSLSYRDSIGDGQHMQTLASINNGETWVPQSAATPQTYMGFALPGERQPDFISQLFSQLWVDTVIDATEHLTLDRDVPLDGSIVLDLRYL